MSADLKPSQDPTKATILVVEDDPAVLRAVVWVLRMSGYGTREATNGPEALEILAKDPAIDLMFSDVVMPKSMNGVDLAEEARRRHPHLKVLLTTGYSATQVSRSVPGGNRVRVITKPYTNDDLERLLQEMLAE